MLIHYMKEQIWNLHNVHVVVMKYFYVYVKVKEDFKMKMFADSSFRYNT